jgi:alkylated DNA repair dioxygenase AlkB
MNKDETISLIEKELRHVKTKEEFKTAVEKIQNEINPDFTDSVLPEGVKLFKSYIKDTESLVQHILTECIDFPHSNSLCTNSNHERLFEEYLYLSSQPSERLHESKLRRLRWSCIGVHYDWTNRSYDFYKKSEFSQEILEIYKKVLLESGIDSSRHHEGSKFSCLINFYHSHRFSDRLGCHRDDVEVNPSPLVLISLGVTGIFIAGKNSAILLEDGDILVMYGKDGRQIIHGVPSILSNEKFLDSKKSLVSDFMTKTRISLSIRQL